MDLLKDEDYSLTHTKIENTVPYKNNNINKLKKVSGITVNTTHGAEISIEKIKSLFNPDVESMEGAAFFYACLLEGITCSQIRTISNKIEKRNKENWDIPLAVKNLCETSLAIINSL